MLDFAALLQLVVSKLSHSITAASQLIRMMLRASLTVGTVVSFHSIALSQFSPTQTRRARTGYQRYSDKPQQCIAPT